MKLSIIIPVYNAEKYIKKCLDSVLKNKDSSFEIILINDGSTDKSLEIINDFSTINDNITIINNDNNGVSFSRNLGIEKATGKYVMFVDADDELKENWYDNLKKYLDGEKDIVYFSRHILKQTDKDILRYIIGYNDENICIACPGSKIFKKSLLINNNIRFNRNIINGEDMLFNMECFKYANDFQVINYSFYLYRKYIGQTTKKFDKRIFESDLHFHKILENILEDLNIESDEKQILRNYCLESAIIILYDRISYIKTYKEAKKAISILYNSPYNTITNANLLNNKSNKIKYLLYKKKYKKVLYYILKLNHKLKYKNKKYDLVYI